MTGCRWLWLHAAGGLADALAHPVGEARPTPCIHVRARRAATTGALKGALDSVEGSGVLDSVEVAHPENMEGKGLPHGVTPDMAKQSRKRSASGSRANSAAAGSGEKRTQNRYRSESNETKRAPP
eukprot:3245020-Alexandrium_andersonii.AAC.1